MRFAGQQFCNRVKAPFAHRAQTAQPGRSDAKRAMFASTCGAAVRQTNKTTTNRGRERKICWTVTTPAGPSGKGR